MITIEVGAYLPRYGRPIYVSVVEVHEDKREWIEENYAFLPDRAKMVASRFRTDFSQVEFPNGYFQPADLMEEAVLRAHHLAQNLIFEESPATHREFFALLPSHQSQKLEKPPFIRFKLFGNFVPEMRSIAKSTDSEELRSMVNEALKVPTVRRTSDSFL